MWYIYSLYISITVVCCEESIEMIVEQLFDSKLSHGSLNLDYFNSSEILKIMKVVQKYIGIKYLFDIPTQKSARKIGSMIFKFS